MLVPAVFAATAAAAYAGFSTTASAAQPVATARLQPPTALAVTQVNCKNGKAPTLSLSWTASTSSFAGGYTIYRAPTTGGPYASIGTVSATTTAFADPSTTLAYSQAYFYVVDATYGSWTSRSAEASITTLSNKCA